jgi:hypothetical protein
MSDVYVHKNDDEDITLIRVGTRENGVFIELYDDGTWGYTVIKDGNIAESKDFNQK